MTLSADLKNAILQAAISGKLGTNNPEEQSAELVKSLVEDINSKVASKEIKKKKQYKDISDDELYIDVPDNWTVVRLNDISEIITDGVHQTPHYLNDGVRFISATNIRDEEISFENCKYISEDLFKEIDNRCHIRKDTLLISKSGSLGTVAIVGEDTKFGIFESLAVVNLAPGLNIEYMRLALKYLFIVATNDLSKGIGVKHLHLNVIAGLSVPIPPLPEQQRIVEKWNSIIPLIEEYSLYEQQLEVNKSKIPIDLRYSILQDAMQGKLTEQLETDGDTDDILSYIRENFNKKIKECENDSSYVFPDNWKCVKLVDACSIYTGNSIPETVKETRFKGQKDGYDYIGTKDVQFDHTIVYDNGVKIPYNEPDFRYAEKDATLLCIEGGSAGRKIAILEKKVCFGNKLCAFHPIGINRKFLYYYLQSPIFLKTFMDKVSGIIGGVSINKIKKMILPIPPLEEQERIVNKLDILLPLCDGLITD